MLTSNLGQYWWEEIPGPRSLVAGIVDSVAAGQNTILEMPKTVPWRDCLEGAVLHLLEQQAEVRDLALVGPDELLPEGRTPGNLLLETYASREIATSYRSGMGKSIAQYIVEQRLFANKIIWVRGVPEEQEQAWIGFCNEYPSHSIGDGIVVVETCQAHRCVDRRVATVIDGSARVTSFDVLLFNSALVAASDTRDMAPESLAYRAALLTRLCGGDVELSAFVNASKGTESAGGMVQCLGEMSASVTSSSGKRTDDDRETESTECGTRSDLKRKVWEAQVETLYELIEKERGEIILLIRDDLERCLSTHEIVQYNEKLTDPFEVECGTLVYLMARGWLIIPRETGDRVRLLRRLRNTIAHGSMCGDEDVEKLLSRYQQRMRSRF